MKIAHQDSPHFLRFALLLSCGLSRSKKAYKMSNKINQILRNSTSRIKESFNYDHKTRETKLQHCVTSDFRNILKNAEIDQKNLSSLLCSRFIAAEIVPHMPSPYTCDTKVTLKKVNRLIHAQFFDMV